LRRRGVDRAGLHRLRAAFRLLFADDAAGTVFSQRLSTLRAQEHDPLVTEMLEFVEAPSHRGLIRASLGMREEDEAAQ